jgi:hypothetical protein
MVAAAPADELEETEDLVGEAVVDAVLDPVLDAALPVPVADGELSALLLLLSEGVDDETCPEAGSSWPQ